MRTVATAAFLLFGAAFNIWTLYWTDQIYTPFVTNDWLINYEGGFVRRGLAGQLLLHVASATHLPLWMLVFGLRAMLYGAIAVLTIRKLAGRLSLTGWIFVLSPVTFLFEVYDPGGAGRKELLFLLVLAANSLVLEKKAPRQAPLTLAYYALLTLVLATGILVHETFLFYLPLLLLQLASYGRLRESRLLALPLAVSLLAFAAVSANKGSPATVEHILRSLAPLVPGISCATNGGAICYLSSTTADALAYVFVPEIGELLLIPMLILLGYSAVFLRSMSDARAAGKPAGGARDVELLLILALLSLLPLFAVAVDYGRWIHVFVSGLFFALPRHVLVRGDGAPGRPHAKTTWLLVVLFSLSWSIIHTRANTFQPGALGRLASAIPVARLLPKPAPLAAPLRFAAPGAVFRWKGCELPSAIGKPTAACAVEKRDRAEAGHLTYGPYEALPAGDYSVDIRYTSAEPTTDVPGTWDIAVVDPQGSTVLAQGPLEGSGAAVARVAAEFSIDAAHAMHLVEIRTVAYADKSLQVESIELRRLR